MTKPDLHHLSSAAILGAKEGIKKPENTIYPDSAVVIDLKRKEQKEQKETAEELYRKFEEEHKADIRNEIANDPFFDSLREKMTKATGKEMKKEEFTDFLLGREMSFCRHIIMRISFLHHNNLANGFGEKEFVNFTTNSFYDVDETLGTTFSDKSSDWKIRPSAVYLLSFIKYKMSVQIGLCTTRKRKYLDRQISDPNEKYSLNELSTLIDKDKVLTLGEDDGNYDGEYLRKIYPGYRDYSFEDIVKESLKGVPYKDGYLGPIDVDESKVEQFVQKVNFEGLIDFLKMYTGVSLGIDEQEIKRCIDEYTNDFCRNESSLVCNIDTLQQRILKLEPGMKGTNFLVPKLLLNFFTDLRKDSDMQKIFESVFGDGQNSINPVKTRFDYENVLKERKYAEKMADKFESILPKDSPFLKLDYNKKNAQIVTVMRRIVAGVGYVKRNQKSVTIIIDNTEVAQVFDSLFMGELQDEKGETIDAYEFLQIQEYRHRLHLISCGQRGEFSKEKIHEEFAKAA